MSNICECDCDCMDDYEDSSDCEFDKCLPYKVKMQRLEIANDKAKDKYSCLLEKYEDLQAKYKKLKDDCELKDSKKDKKDDDEAKPKVDVEDPETKKLKEENTILKKTITTLKETITRMKNTKTTSSKKLLNGNGTEMITTLVFGKKQKEEIITYKDGKEVDRKINNYDEDGNLKN